MVEYVRDDERVRYFEHERHEIYEKGCHSKRIGWANLETKDTKLQMAYLMKLHMAYLTLRSYSKPS